MNQPTKHVIINLKTVIQDGSHQEKSHVKAKGVFLQKGNLEVLNFKEEIEDGEITTLITIQSDQVTIKRSGAVTMHQQFRLGQKTENVYKHPHGNIHMETFTNHFIYQKMASGERARLEIRYNVTLNGQIERKHMLELEFIEEDSR